MKELLKQTIKGSNEQTVVEYFLLITKNVVKCTEINEKGPVRTCRQFFKFITNDFNFIGFEWSILPFVSSYNLSLKNCIFPFFIFHILTSYNQTHFYHFIISIFHFLRTFFI